MTTPNEELRARLPELPSPAHESLGWIGDEPRRYYTAEQLQDYAIAALARQEEGREAVAWLLPEYGRAFVKQENLHDFLMERVPSYRVTAAASKAIPLYPPNEMSGNPCHHCGADPGEPCYPNDVCHPAPHSGGDMDDSTRDEMFGYVDACADVLRHKGKPIMARELSAIARRLATPTPQAGEARRFRGIGELERTGYLPEGTAAEREAAPPVATAGQQAAGVSEEVVTTALDAMVEHNVLRLDSSWEQDCSAMRAALEAVWPAAAGAAPEGITKCGHSKYDPCRNCDAQQTGAQHGQEGRE